MCNNCMLIELKIKSYFLQNKISIFLINKIISKYTSKCFKNNNNKIINYIINTLELNSYIIQELNLISFINNITKNSNNLIYY
jgi:hypothetical protein